MKKLILALAVLVSLSAAAQRSQDKKKMDAFITNLMKKMTIEEKIGQLNLVTPGGGIATGAVVSSNVEAKIKEGKVGGLFGVHGPEKVRQAQDFAVKQTRMKIPLLFGSDVIHGYKTIFPIPLGLSASWDMALIERSARIAALESTANGLNWNFSPMVDIARDPRWGRVAEGAGEDPYLGSQIARAMVRGYQGDDMTKPTTMMACVKHFILYGAAEAGRDYNTTDMSRIKMFNEYLPPYKAAIDAGVGSVMSSFNDIDAVPATGNKWVLTDLLRGRWGFDGFVVSDYTSVNEMIAHGMGDLQAVSALALKAGLDMDMVGEGFLTTLPKSLKEGKVTEKEIDQSCRRILEAKYKLGLFDDPYRYIDTSRPAKEILTADTRKAAREIAARSFVLLKNNNQVLPLKKSGTIALVGPLANNKNNMLGTWAVSGDPQTSIPLLEGMKNVAGNGVNIIYAKGANITNDTLLAKKVNVFGTRIDIDKRSPEEMLKEAVEAARKADVVVAAVGEASEMSGESSSRSDITLPESQKKLVRALVQTGKPVVLVMMSGRPLALEEENELTTAMLQTWHAGSEAGNAIADVLFGDYNPSGKLTATFPRNVGQVPIYYSQRTTGRPATSEEFKKFQSNYLDVPNSPLFPFGYGLSYTTFSYGDVKLNKNSMKPNEAITATVTLTNTGKYDGEEVVQLYIRDVVCSITRPVKELKGFQKVFLKAGESKEVSFKITAEDLKFYNSELNYVAEPGDFKVFIGTSSQEVKEADFKLQ
ncbi:beta-glucosidase BglX [Botryobacter ruber]|uniref:beta-glucosidase BglX n=1 Tax=Botryobacter ruber TaxID=2171629 RepID=UPI000E09E175|nr:beta-glucosidase BglX [Botryobacter ruber]